MKRLSIKARVTFWYTLLVALIALLAAGALRMVQPGADGHFYGAVLAEQDEAKLRAGA